MSNEYEKHKHGERVNQKFKKIKRRLKQAKEFGWDHILKIPHMVHKMSPFNCGDPKCHMCGNPRKFFKEKTIQERRFEQTKDDE